MPTALDTRMRATATRLIAKFGRPMVLRKQETGDYVPADGVSEVNSVDYDVVGFISAPSNYMLANGLAQSGDRIVQVAAETLQVEPQPGDQLVMDSETWQVVSMCKTFSGEQVALYEMQARV